ncbi:hypothetical protein [Oecophyllibacter saccharovorans]|uniref:Uncharacterized protein n=1 Tax=Oecophyllibacter saccharovorans TaxID=2558360 RepID=A0A506UKN8_9PROT|nr:hypothetical protein [Oecophyllibacter saccharovorans]QDH15048.1 hypothetical protein E3E11_03270 [Oecophyllibacter saccharovorans]TPW33888.1 hypothetical protein E3202_04665 [Oecophyllibacter saccharovorans]TPW35231.1 hypothetical protein E3203_07180 [Oecophyllibacter saccharovorans]
MTLSSSFISSSPRFIVTPRPAGARSPARPPVGKLPLGTTSRSRSDRTQAPENCPGLFDQVIQSLHGTSLSDLSASEIWTALQAAQRDNPLCARILAVLSTHLLGQNRAD